MLDNKRTNYSDVQFSFGFGFQVPFFFLRAM